MTNDQKLVVAEVFYSIQGEGPYTGYPAVFLRLGGCNLLCQSKEWVCDTIEVWKKGKSTTFDKILLPEHIQSLLRGAHLVVTGGEPLLQKEKLCQFLFWLSSNHNVRPFVEIETNGTIDPAGCFAYIHHFNVSPKLANSGESYERRVNNVVLLKIIRQAESYCFKFVVNCQEDIVDIHEEYDMIDGKDIVLMPAGDTREKLDKIRLPIIELCKAMGYRYSDRLHIVTWDKKTGV